MVRLTASLQARMLCTFQRPCRPWPPRRGPAGLRAG